ncbi:MAG TPA: VOC family protein [Acidimicrobiales bacterium]|nr:VOC family protein [Acidimicrobiales bacterium]
MTVPSGHLAHFAINADDMTAARRFYGAVFGWTFEAWGPPEFFHIHTADGTPPANAAALQARRDLAPGRPTTGFECTVAVDDVDAVTAAVRANGGEVLMEKTTLSGIGDLVWFADPSGNVVGAMRYDATAD